MEDLEESALRASKTWILGNGIGKPQERRRGYWIEAAN